MRAFQTICGCRHLRFERSRAKVLFLEGCNLLHCASPLAALLKRTSTLEELNFGSGSVDYEDFKTLLPRLCGRPKKKFRKAIQVGPQYAASDEAFLHLMTFITAHGHKSTELYLDADNRFTSVAGKSENWNVVRAQRSVNASHGSLLHLSRLVLFVSPHVTLTLVRFHLSERVVLNN